MDDLINEFSLDQNVLGYLTSAVQSGFIVGTLIFAVLSLADRFSPSAVFLTSSLCGVFFNTALILEGNTLFSLVLFRFFTGFFLAGIYPVGMKIAADHFDSKLGTSLGYLLGALVLGTALPHLLRDIAGGVSWRYVLLATSGLALTGGALMFMLVPDGPYRKKGSTVKLSAFLKVFRDPGLRSAAFGYFGHMWELYAFWAFVPVMIGSVADSGVQMNVPMWSFIIIAAGAPACVAGGYLSRSIGARRTAFLALSVSCCCCLVAPFVLNTAMPILIIPFLFLWAFTVIPDSPMFSTLVARNAAAEVKGTALTIVNCIGFTITIFSIMLVSTLKNTFDSSFVYVLLATGPLVGLLAMRKDTQRGIRRP
jgi:MFS family permease